MPTFTRYLICLILILISFTVYSQNSSTLDSLKQELKTAKNKAHILNRLAEEYISVAPEETDKFANEALHYAIRKKDTVEMATALWFIARVHTAFGNYERSNQHADSASIFFRKIEDFAQVVNCEVLKASNLMLQGKYETALALYASCIPLAVELEAKDIQTSILINMGRIYRVTGKHKEAMENFEKALEIAVKINDNYLIAHSYHFIGLVYKDQQYFDLAIDHFLKSLTIHEELNSRHHIPYLLIDLGSACRESKNFLEALEYLNTASEYFVNSNDRWGLYELNRNMGLAYFEIENLDSAWNCFQKSLEYSREINEKAGESNAMNYLGEILIHKQKYDSALVYLKKAFELNTEVKNDLMLINILFNTGTCYVYMGNPQKGLSILKRSLALADSLDIRYERMIINKEISTAYTNLKNYRKALEHYAVYTAINDSIYREESNRHFAEMERKFQSEKQKQEIGELKLDKAEQDIIIRKQRSMRNILILGFLFASVIGIISYRSYRMKKKADSEKEALLKEIHHRVKNNLQIISSLLSIQSENITDNKVINAVYESQSRVKAMALIHQLLYQDQDLSQINFGIYLPQLVNTVSSIFKKDNLKVDSEIIADDISFDIDTAIPLGLIVAELVSNSYKYAFNGHDKGQITVLLEHKTGDDYILLVADNGKGLPDSVDFTKLSSMGLRLVNILTNQLDGKLSYEYNKGAKFTIEFSHVI